MKKEIKKALKFDKFKNLLAFTGEVLVWNIPAMAGAALLSTELLPLRVVGGVLLILQSLVMGIKAISITEEQGRDLSLGPKFKHLLNYFPLKSLNAIKEEVILKDRKGLPQDASQLLDFVMYGDLLEKISTSYAYKNQYHIDFTEVLDIIDKSSIDFAPLINERLGEVDFFDINSFPRAFFILRHTQYHLKPEDYIKIGELFQTNEYNERVANLFSNKNLVADWQKIIDIADVEIKDKKVYEAFVGILKNKTPAQKNMHIASVVSSGPVSEIETTLLYSPNFQAEKWTEIKECYKRLATDDTFTNTLKENIPFLINYDKNLVNIRSERALSQTKKNISDILDVIITEAHQLIEDAEMLQVKELRIMHKNSKIKL